MTGSILVLGARGRVGSALVEDLIRRGEPVTAASRETSESPTHAPGVRSVRFDFEDPTTFRASLRGADRVFLIARPGDERADDFSIPFLDEARRMGVRRVVDLSAMGVERLEGTALRRIERHLETSGMEWTHLRPNWFMQIFGDDPLRAAVRASGALRIPAGRARLSFIDSRDIGAVAARALTAAGHTGRAYTLTGGCALDHSEVAAAIGRASGRRVRYEPLDDQAAAEDLLRAGFTPQRIERLIGFYALVRAGLCSPVSPDVESVLGRPPITFDEFARDYAGTWE